MRLSAAFLQYWGLYDEKVWTRVMNAMRVAKLNTVIIQYLENPVTNFYPPNPDDFDPTRFILSYCDPHEDMDVFIGLHSDPTFMEPTNWQNAVYAKGLNAPNGEADKNCRLADLVWKRHGKGPDGKKLHRSFAGWYLSNEMWNQRYTAEQTQELRKFYRTISDHCKSLDKNNLPVAVSPYFNPLDQVTYYNPTDYAQAFGEFLKSADGLEHAGIDVVMLQDGVGERRLTEANLKTIVPPYFEQFRDKCKEKGVQFWANLENWEYNPNYWPTNIKRFDAQIRALDAQPALVSKMVTFEFFHYMNQFGDSHPDPKYQHEERDLYWCYLHRFVPEAVQPGDPLCPTPIP